MRGRETKINQRAVKMSDEKRQEAIEKQFGRTIVDRKFVVAVIERYHADHVRPLHQYVAYQKLWPWQKALVQLDRLKDWLHSLYMKAAHRVYRWKWERISK